MNYLDAIVLTGLDIVNGERTQSSIYHLLKGKKTSQTIQDAQLYGISPLFQLYRSMKRSYYDQRIACYSSEGLVAEHEDLKYRLTSKGRNELTEFFSEHPYPLYLNGWKYHDITLIFWRRLTLLIQTASNLIHHHVQFIPVNRDLHIQQWVKHTINHNRHRLKDFTGELYRELTDLLEMNDFPDSPEIIVQQLSGYRQVGYTNRQLADQFNCGADEIYTRFINALHFLFSVVENDHSRFPVLSECMNLNKPETIPFTKSTEETYKYVLKNVPIDQIATIRHLKRSTIEDHILEIALLDKHFSIDSYVTETLINKIKELHGKSNRLKYIKDQLPEADYFQIRLVLAKAERGEQVWKRYLKNNLDIPHSVQDRKKSFRPS
ncbi:helix-turn-helix domain-containing protein [Jeotgalibacillus haloalkalitolerans]|uniref:Helix-turn-helix domain-containing protein n=1 Tax=Jeotgalibacillus haloalkalitolerans TaxID=3104292 RepID=A0ABU5KL95_9BACL|nr:helix-turn-helix domain-containing protein [Jeotgalibacillus sp. HH7-29]MDZ5712040.1 helix-turn-helix domain-containing protein [Jeotgalibacillus sp. HH7-29]